MFCSWSRQQVGVIPLQSWRVPFCSILSTPQPPHVSLCFLIPTITTNIPSHQNHKGFSYELPSTNGELF